MTPTKHAIRQSTLESITEAAVAALVTNSGASMSEIAALAGIGRATLHRHFPTKAHLIDALGHRCIEETNAAVEALVDPEESSLQRLEKTFAAVIPLGDRYSFLNRRSDDEALNAAYRDQLRWVRALVADLKRDGYLDTDVPDQWALAQIDQLIWSAWEFVSRGHTKNEDAVALAVRTLLQGLGQTPVETAP